LSGAFNHIKLAAPIANLTSVRVDVQCLVSCLDELATALSTIFLTRLVSSNVNAIVVASFQAESRMKQEMAVCRTHPLVLSEAHFAKSQGDIDAVLLSSPARTEISPLSPLFMI
jgi:hypothetical protein